MGTGVIFYEEIAEDIVQTWDQFETLCAERLRIRSFLFDPDRPYDLPISAIRPDRGVSHPSPPRHPPVPPPFGPSSSHYSLGPDYVEVLMIPPRSCYTPPYDPLYDLAGFIDEYYRRPPEAVPAQIEADPVEDPMDTDTGEDEDPKKAEQSEDSEDTRPDECSVVSTDTCESRA
ncbi:hypothetical protein PIB30_105727 [Stylosanthes scabra]|uniref:Uncharacterized protein n=1 Tax=Stylosanthes scabra TaxID=79078 RepID=A0ABU6X182_9FABA|nr:hypothetical protein [Stylosanthes scabra]